MRILLLTALAAFALAGCKKNDQQDNMINAGDNLTAASIVSNDVTAIDAVTGDAANMAADVDMNFGGVQDNGASAIANSGAAKPAKPAAGKSKSPAPETNSTANAVGNAE